MLNSIKCRSVLISILTSNPTTTRTFRSCTYRPFTVAACVFPQYNNIVMRKAALCSSALFISLFLSNWQFTYAKTCLSPSWIIDRVRPLSNSKGGMSKYVGANPEWKAVLVDLLDHVEYLGCRKKSKLSECRRTPQAKAMFEVAALQARHMGLGKLEDYLISVHTGSGNSSCQARSKSVFHLLYCNSP